MAVSPSDLSRFRAFLEGATTAAVAAELDLTESAVYLAKHRCLKLLRGYDAELGENYELG